MKIAVLGLWHLGAVTAACIARDHNVSGWDPDERVLENLREARPPLFEPGLAEAIDDGLRSHRLSFESTAESAVRDADVVWVAFDTPIIAGDMPDVAFVERQVLAAFPYIKAHSTVLISSQVPVGTTRRLAQAFVDSHPGKNVRFAYSPENLRLGTAINSFMSPARIVIGVDDDSDHVVLQHLLEPLGPIETMRVESAEMSKHAINAFLGVSVVLINEIARICEQHGADIREVERALRSEPRIGQSAYVAAGTGIAGGTLSRDIAVLRDIGYSGGTCVALLDGAVESNSIQRSWTLNKICDVLGDLRGKKIAVLGLTYKPGTDTLRGSDAVDLCAGLLGCGAIVSAYDPVVRALPASLSRASLCSTVFDAISGASAAIVATAWPDIIETKPSAFAELMATPNVFDPMGVFRGRQDAKVRYFSVGASCDVVLPQK